MTERIITITHARPEIVDWLRVAESFALPFVTFLAVTALVAVILQFNKASD